MTDHMIVLPGGGYLRHAAHEAEIVADWFATLGVSASVLRYPVSTRHPAPLQAVRREIRSQRAAGAERIGLCGFSAGGHAAGLAALAPQTHADERVDAVILGYPVVSMTTGPHPGSRDRLLGADASDEAALAVSLEHLVTADAPPFFVWHTAEDATVPVSHSLHLAESFRGAGSDLELHVFPHGHHGLGLAEGHRAGVWRDLAASWLAHQGWGTPRSRLTRAPG